MEEAKKATYLGTEKIPKLMLRFSIPCVLSLLISALYNIVDQIFVGNSELSDLGNAATGIVFPIFIIAQAFTRWFAAPAADLIAIAVSVALTIVYFKKLNKEQREAQPLTTEEPLSE